MSTRQLPKIGPATRAHSSPLKPRSSRILRFKMKLNHCFLFTGLCLALSTFSSILPAQEVGDRIVVTASFKTMILDKKVDQVFGGAIHTIDAVKGTWCQLDNVKGWLPLENVMNLKMGFKYFDERVEDNELDADAYATRGMIYFEWEELGKAFYDLNESLRINRGNAMTWNNRGKILNAQMKYDLALKDFAQAIRLNPKFIRAYVNRGLVFYAVGDHERAVADYDRAIEMNPEDPWVYVNRGSAKSDSGNLDGAMEDYTKAIELNERIAEAYIGRSNVFLANEEFEKALEETNKACSLDRRNGQALNSRGWVKYQMGSTDEAILDFNRAIRYAPTMRVAYDNRGICHVSSGNFLAAVDDYDKSLNITEKSPITLTNRGTAFLGLGEYTRAEKDFSAALKLAPNFPDSYNGLAWFRATCTNAKFRDGEKALEYAKKAVELSAPDQWNMIDTLAAAYAENGKFDDAKRLQLQVIELAPEKAREAVQERLELYRKGKPYRSDIGKTSEKKNQTPTKSGT